ncbi:hypothetical protein [uncultured Cedecea sp.]|uniref:hypothetical protein n=1 Tax=uncultured Cedecea sp. TaxID=988762 RepID=UPI002626B56D|nr:hypothetical protein [uncultured Cedecea sp.]
MTNKRLYNKPRYITQRGKTFYINFRLPSGTFFRQSLGTDSLKAVEVTMSRLTPFIPLVQNGTMSEETFRAKINGVREMTLEGLNRLLLNILEITIEDADFSSPNSRYYNSTQSLDVLAKQAKTMADVMRSKMVNVDADTASRLWGLDKEFIIPEDLKPSLLDNTKRMIHFHDLQFQAINAFSSGDAPRYEKIMDIFSKEKANIAQAISPCTLAEEEADCPLLSDAWKMFTSEKGKGWASTTAKENQRFYDVLLYVIGDIPVDEITKQHIRKTIGVIKGLPRRNKNPYSEMTLEECIECDVPEDNLLSSQHVEKHLKIYCKRHPTTVWFIPPVAVI